MASDSRADHDTLAPAFDPAATDQVQDPPRTFGKTLRQLGPGLIIAGSIVGSGELIATTKTGAQAGIALLWLIIIGCIIKVFVQVELGRHSITHGQTSLAALDTVPGPRLRVNWVLWIWLVMMLAAIAQLGGIVGGVGQSLAIAFPITGDYQQAILVPAEDELQNYLAWKDDLDGDRTKFDALSERQQERILRGQAAMQKRLDVLGSRADEVLAKVQAGEKLVDPRTVDDRYWAAAAALVTVVLLYNGRYRLIQSISTVLVISFTFITIGNVYKLQTTEQWHIPTSEILRGLTLGLPEAMEGIDPLMTALATFGIIGVGATELISYPYWCIEKGYARYTGQRTDDDAWAIRARGWMRVMQIDAFFSMIVYTVATLAFFLMGVAVLYSEGLDPDGMRMVSTLATAYVPVFGEHAKWLFLLGAIAVLYSTFLVALAGQTRIYTDALKIWGFLDKHDQKQHDRSVSTFGVLLPLICLTLYWSGINPVSAVLLSGTMQAIMLPVIGFSAIYFRWTASDRRLAPSRVWDVMLVVSCVGLLIAGAWGLYSRLAPYVSRLMET
ncbi:divalent metal cation transporter [Maioricimonas sp. JC845]|uniref:NRAMP family divalent metal transporter n=1 Tax=Maioricimonas sp. JC845 TaxID=3232138 RepID=UPI003458170B